VKIATASMSFAARHSATASHELRETLRAWNGSPRIDAGSNALAHQAVPLPDISAAAYSVQAQRQFETQTIFDAMDPTDDDPLLQLIRTMLELISGQIFKVFSPRDMEAVQSSPALADPKSASSPSSGPDRSRVGVEYQRQEVISETEQTDFHAAGTVRTADGMEIGFQLDLSMRRSFRQEINLNQSAGAARQVDPLVINFGGTAAQLQSRRFLFDLAGNGQKENIPLLASGSGFLALDLNANGLIDSGKELFGAASGNGFADLARHDSDGNGWIDENDPVFAKLQVWSPDREGPGSLVGLQQKNVGALFLGKQATPFELRDSNNLSLGTVRGSGIYLDQQGVAGTLQQIDLSV